MKINTIDQRPRIRKAGASALLLGFLLGGSFSSAQSITQQIDALFSEAYAVHSPGATVLIAKDDEIIYRNAFGLANLELQVPMRPENVMELASMTKQFTSVAILMLMEQGKLSLDDPLSKYLVDYPRGNDVSIHHLLNHTSGIKNYTNVIEFREKTRTDLTPWDIINGIKEIPLDFNPGEDHAYSNSGYVLLGYIIEQVSGLSYEEFIQKAIFDTVGMKNSHYVSRYNVIPNRASGYQLYGGSYENAEYMSPNFAYAAGALMSTVDDMFLWSKAMRHNTLVSESARQLAFFNHTLNNGKQINYGYGWAINEIADMTSIEHTGGIPGFTTSSIYLPEGNIYSVVLTNRDTGIGPEALNIRATSLVAGKPIIEKPALKLTEDQLKKWVGAYQFEGVVRLITYEDGTLYSARKGGRPRKLIPVSDNEFQIEGNLATYSFVTSNDIREAHYTDRIDRNVGFEIEHN